MITCWRLNQRCRSFDISLTSGDAFRSFGLHLARWTYMTCWVGSWLCEMDGYELKKKILNHLITSTSTSHTTCWKDLYIYQKKSANTNKNGSSWKAVSKSVGHIQTIHLERSIHLFAPLGGRCSDQKTWPWCHWILTSKKQRVMICTPEISFAILSKP